MEILKDYPRAGIPVLHWFSGSRLELRRAIALGCWFSVGPAMMMSKKGRSLLEEMPIDRVLPESDGPFAQVRGAPLMPWEASNISEQLSVLMGKSKADANGLLRENLKRLLSSLPN
jgi:TatD DNase family protein